MKRSFKSVAFDGIKKAFSLAGLSVQFKRNSLVEPVVLGRALQQNPIDFAIDVGANCGQYGRLLRSLGYSGPLVSIEPLREAHAQLLEAAKNDPGWTIQDRTCVGASTGEVTMNVASNLASSSLLPMLSRHEDAFPGAHMEATEKVPMTTLDLIGASMPRFKSGLLKIDTQGFELEVLKGARATLPSVRLLQVELSLVPLYSGQPLISDISAFLDDAGFQLRYIVPGFTDSRTGELLQLDGIFVRQDGSRAS